jgi:hypothetical protein
MKPNHMVATALATGTIMGAVWCLAETKPNMEVQEVLSKNPIGRKLSPVDLAEAFLTVETYVYGKPPSEDSLRIVDRVRNKQVVLTLISTDKTSEHWLDPHTVAILAAFSSEEGDDYELVFAVTQKRGTDTVYYGPFKVNADVLDQMVVQDVGIFSVNGVPRFRFREKDDGYWELERIDREM